MTEPNYMTVRELLEHIGAPYGRTGQMSPNDLLELVYEEGGSCVRKFRFNPTSAALLFETTKRSQRPPKTRAKLGKFIRDREDGDWRFNGMPIMIHILWDSKTPFGDAEINLSDGQTRLQAMMHTPMVDYPAAMWFNVNFMLVDDILDIESDNMTVDINTPRSASDQAKIAGVDKLLNSTDREAGKFNSSVEKIIVTRADPRFDLLPSDAKRPMKLHKMREFYASSARDYMSIIRTGELDDDPTVKLTLPKAGPNSPYSLIPFFMAGILTCEADVNAAREFWSNIANGRFNNGDPAKALWDYYLLGEHVQSKFTHFVTDAKGERRKVPLYSNPRGPGEQKQMRLMIAISHAWRCFYEKKCKLEARDLAVYVAESFKTTGYRLVFEGVDKAKQRHLLLQKAA